MRSAEIEVPEVSIDHLAALQVGVGHPGTSKVGMPEVGFAEHGFGQLHPPARQPSATF